MDFKMDSLQAEPARCALCHSDTTEIVCRRSAQKNGDTYPVTNVLCTACGLIYNNPMPSQESLENYYQGGFTRDHTSTEQGDLDIFIARTKAKQPELKAAETVEFIRDYIAANGSVADIGCSSGVLLHELKKQLGCAVVGVEPDQLMVQMAREYYHLTDIRNEYLKDFVSSNERKYDLIILRHVFEHLPDPDQVLEQLKGMMKDDGYLYIVIPNAADFLESRSLERALEFGHVFSYTPHAIFHMLFKHGFKIVKWRHDYIHHQQIVATRIDNPVNAIAMEKFSAGRNSAQLLRCLKMQDRRFWWYRIKRKASRFLPFNIMSAKWRQAKSK